MNTDLPDDLGPVDPGVERLLRTLTAAPTASELTGERRALTMFRSSQHPTAQLAVPRGPVPLRARWRWRLVLAGGTFAVLVGGVAGAAYAAALPAPVQSFASRELGFLGVPAVHPARPSHTPPAGHAKSPAAGYRTSPAPTSPTSPTVPSTQGTVSRHHRLSASPSPAPSASVDLLSAAASAARITAGGPATIDGTLTRSGGAVSGATVTLLERPAGTAIWKVAGSGRTTSSGNVTIGVPSLVANAAFRLTGPDRAKSPVVRITVRPPVTIHLHLGARAIRDVLVVSTQFARQSNVVVLQVQTANGGWTVLRIHSLNADGKTRFVLDARVLKNKTIRVKLRATLRHAASASEPLRVPPPT